MAQKDMRCTGLDHRCFSEYLKKVLSEKDFDILEKAVNLEFRLFKSARCMAPYLEKYNKIFPNYKPELQITETN